MQELIEVLKAIVTGRVKLRDGIDPGTLVGEGLEILAIMNSKWAPERAKRFLDRIQKLTLSESV